jgi:hypothetical protein
MPVKIRQVSGAGTSSGGFDFSIVDAWQIGSGALSLLCVEAVSKRKFPIKWW